jgi:hypothetical protein
MDTMTTVAAAVAATATATAAPANSAGTTKTFLQSKTLWGIVLMAVPTISKALGHEIAPTDAAGLVNSAQALVNDGLTFGGLVLAIWGRFSAAKPLKLF